MTKPTLAYCILLMTLCQSCVNNSRNKLDIEIQNYISAALDSIRNNALNSSQLSWESIEKEVLNLAKNAQTTEDTYEAIEYAINKLNDNHSFLQKNGVNLSYPDNKSGKEPSPYSSRMNIEHGIHSLNNKLFARIFIPQGMRDNIFAQEIQDIISELSSQNPSGWIVDLRGNGGGNMWPMLAGIGPLVGDNPLGGSIKNDSIIDHYHYEDGKAIYIDESGTRNIYAQAIEKSKQISEQVPLAILIDRSTASSGEALAIILKGRQNTRIFGEKSYGATTSTKGFKLVDSLNLVLAISTFIDRNGTIFVDGIIPDEEILIDSGQLLPENDPIINSAIEWLATEAN